METQRAKVFIVDDYPPMRESLRKLLDLEKDFQVCGEAGDVDAAFRGIQATHPDIVVVDLILGHETGLDLLKRLDGQLQSLPVLILSLLPETLNAETVLNQGARGYIMKSESPDLILVALRQVVQGQLYLSPAVTEQLKKKGYFNHE